MFKILGACDRLSAATRKGCGLIACLLITGCNTVPPLPPADLSASGWVVREGQALWRAKTGAPEIAGEVLLATSNNGEALVQFTKSPFPLILARTTAKTWELRIPTQNRRYSGVGKPPKRLIWLQLPKLLHGDPAPAGWVWSRDGDNWTLENRGTGERVEGYFAQ